VVASRRKLKAPEFEAAVARLVISTDAAERSRRVLVDGESGATVAKEAGISVSAVSQQVARIWRAHVDSLDIPPGHERVSAVLPADKAEIVRTWERDTNRRSR